MVSARGTPRHKRAATGTYYDDPGFFDTAHGEDEDYDSIPENETSSEEDEDDIAQTTKPAEINAFIENFEDAWEDDDSEDEVLYDNGNRESREYYQATIKNLNVSKYKRKNYAPGTVRSIDTAESEWKLYVLVAFALT